MARLSGRQEFLASKLRQKPKHDRPALSLMNPITETETSSCLRPPVSLQYATVRIQYVNIRLVITAILKQPHVSAEKGSHHQVVYLYF